MSSNLQYWAFTWNYENNGELAVDRELVQEFLKERQWRFVYQVEEAPTTLRKHLQGRIDLKSKENRLTKMSMINQFKIAFPNKIQNLTFSPESNASVKKDGLNFYTTKMESRVEGPFMDDTFKVPEKYEAKDLNCMETPFPWQQKVLDEIKGEPNDRRIEWIYEEEGNQGKSKLIKYLCFKKMATKIPMGTAGQLRSCVCQRGAHRVYLVLFTRALGKDDRLEDVFQVVEAIKDGFVDSAMYGKGGDTLYMEPPHVYVFGNFDPFPVLHKLGSMDRWRVRTPEMMGGTGLFAEICNNANMSIATVVEEPKTPNGGVVGHTGEGDYTPEEGDSDFEEGTFEEGEQQPYGPREPYDDSDL